MANFIIRVLEYNQEHYNAAKRIVLEDDNRDGDNLWIVKHLGLLPLMFNVLVGVVLCVASIITFPFMVLMMIVNAPYCLYKYIMSQPYFMHKYIKASLAEFETKLNKRSAYGLMSINTRSTLINTVNNPKAFLRRFFKEYNTNHYTIVDDLDKHIICGPNRRRSIEDIYQITRYYFPKVTLDQVIKLLIELVHENCLGLSKCNDIKKYVFVNKCPYTGVYLDKELEFIAGVNFRQLIKYYERT